LVQNFHHHPTNRSYELLETAKGDLGVIISKNHPYRFYQNHPTSKIYTSQSALVEEVFSGAFEAGSAYTAADFAMAHTRPFRRPLHVVAGGGGDCTDSASKFNLLFQSI